ncbi:hypothetical protein [Erythrobacter sp.]|uniref:hypothetical protein n=1 Tax=Erythrobacter sp. TaxID=1042 RepID=UPI0025C1561D|nr:hypothetical protein [Erythrobacter sp.]
MVISVLAGVIILSRNPYLPPAAGQAGGLRPSSSRLHRRSIAMSAISEKMIAFFLALTITGTTLDAILV